MTRLHNPAILSWSVPQTEVKALVHRKCPENRRLSLQLVWPCLLHSFVEMLMLGVSDSSSELSVRAILEVPLALKIKP